MSVLKFVLDSCPLSEGPASIVVSYYIENEHKHVLVMADLCVATARVRLDLHKGSVHDVPLTKTGVRRHPKTRIWQCIRLQHE